MSVQLPDINLTNNPFVLDLHGIEFDSLSWIDFLNESPQTLKMQIGGVQFPVPAWTHYPVEVQRNINSVWVPVGGAQAPINISPSLLPVLTSNMSNVLIVTLYQKGQVPAITTPQPLFRQGWVPNTVSGTSGTADKLQNDGSSVPTQVVEITPLGDVNSSFTLRNDAILSLGTRTGTPGNLNVFGGVQGVINADGSIGVGNPQTIELIGATGQITAQNIILQHGNMITGISHFGLYVVGTTQQSFAHNLGAVPDIVIVQLSGTSSTSAIVKVDYTSFDSVNFKATGSLSGLSFAGIALKFS